MHKGVSNNETARHSDYCIYVLFYIQYITGLNDFINQI